MTTQKLIAVLTVLSTIAGMAYAGPESLGTAFSYIGGVSNTRHNLTQRQPGSAEPNGSMMDTYRNNYQEVCVYCHTPHGANTTVSLPLWNRTMKTTVYTTYNQLGTSSLTQTVSQPGINSLACLSCHDGQTAMDSIINMPGSGRYNKSQETTQNNSFLDTWPSAARGRTHWGLSQSECLSCHSPNGNPAGLGAVDFSIAAIGTDLQNDHPVGVTFPTNSGPGTDFNKPEGRAGTASFFEVAGPNNTAGRMDKGEIRLYATGNKLQVECASCHDPHGVPSGGSGSTFFPTFLRMSNDGSKLCLTCHTK